MPTSPTRWWRWPGVPELPEIRVHAGRLRDQFCGAVLTSIDVLSFAALKSVLPSRSDISGRAITDVSTRGKLFIIDADGLAFVVHLMQGGRLKPDPKPTKKPRGGMVRWRFEDHDALLLTEAGTERRAGVWVAATSEIDALDPLAGLGPDIDTLTADEFADLLAGAGGSRLHGVLRRQTRWAGIGRRLANEICWKAELSPFSRANSITGEDRDRLFAAVHSMIADSVADESTRDEMVRSADRLSCVHHRVGEPCPRCGDTIASVSYRAYEVDYCPTCQTGGRRLADNTTSKFLK